MSSEIAMAFLLGAIAEFILSAYFIWRPRMLQLMAERDEERERRIHLEDAADASEREQVKVLAEWEEPMELIVGEHPGQLRIEDGEDASE